jgi:hypothetical protein
MPSKPLKAEGILQEEATPLYWLSYTKNNIMNALAASKRNALPRNEEALFAG